MSEIAQITFPENVNSVAGNDRSAPVFKGATTGKIYVLSDSGAYYTIPFDANYDYSYCFGISSDLSMIVFGASGIASNKIRIVSGSGSVIEDITTSNTPQYGAFLTRQNLILTKGDNSGLGSLMFDVRELDGTIVGSLSHPDPGFWASIGCAGNTLWTHRYSLDTTPNNWLYHVDLES
jgi:hypothetical protein